MTGIVTVKAFKCERCGYVWIPRSWESNKPSTCAKCKSPAWNKPLNKGEKVQRRKRG